MYFDRFDICAAYLCFACLYHGGMGSPEYRIFGRLNRIGYGPPGQGSHADDPDHLEENARAIFDALVERHGFEPYSAS